MNCLDISCSDNLSPLKLERVMTDEYLAEISKYVQAMNETADQTPQHQAAKLLAQSYLILYNAQPTIEQHLSLDQFAQNSVIKEISLH